MIVYLFSPVQYECFLSKDSAMRASTQDISTPYLLSFIYYYYYNCWSLINIHCFIYCLSIIIALIIIIILFYIFIIISIIWVIIY